MFSCEFCETLRKTFFTEHLRAAASVCSSVYSSWVKAIKLLKAQHFTIFLIGKTKNIKLQLLTADEERTLISLAFFKRFSLAEFIWIKEIFVKLIGRIWKKGYSSATGTIDLPVVKGRIILRIWENSRKENTILQNNFNSISGCSIQRQNEGLQNMKRIWHEKCFIELFFKVKAVHFLMVFESALQTLHVVCQ